MPGPFDYLQDGNYVPPFLAEQPAPPEMQPPPFLAPEQSQQQLAPPEVPAPMQQQEQAPAPQAPAPFPVGPGEKVKARVSESGYAPPTYTPRDPMAPLVDAAQGVRDATEAQATGLERMGQLETAYDENVTKWDLEQKAQILADSEADRTEIMGQFEQERQGQLARIQQTIAEIPSRDPKRWWKNMDSFQQSSAYMAAAIDGYLNPGGTNGAVEQANKLAEADAYAQMSDIETAQKKVGYEQSAYERMLGEHEFKRQAFLEAKTYKLESLAVATEQRGMTFRSPIQQHKYAMEANKIRAESQKTLAQLAQNQASMLNAGAERALRERMQKREMAFEVAKQERADAAAAGKAAKDLDDGVLRDPTNNAVVMGSDGHPSRVVGTDGQKADFNTKVAAAFSLEDKLRRFEVLQADVGRVVGGQKVWNSEKEARATALYNQILSDYTRAQSGLAATDTEVARLRQVYPMKKLLSGELAGTLTQFRQNARITLKHEVNTRTTGGWADMETALDQRTGPADEADNSAPALNPAQSLMETRRGIASGAVPPGEATLKKVGSDIEEMAKMVGRGEQVVADVPNEVAVAEAVDQANQLAAELEASGRKVEALQVKNKAAKLQQAGARAQQTAYESGYGPTVGQGTPAPPAVRRGQQTELPGLPLQGFDRPTGLVTP